MMAIPQGDVTQQACIRAAEQADAARISALLCRLGEQFALAPKGKGAEKFLNSVSPAAISQMMGDPQYRCAVGMQGEELVGVVTVREHCHLYHLFVASNHHRQGWGRRLWLHAKEQAQLALQPHPGFTVNASSFAVPVYQRFGFRATEPQRHWGQIIYLPMALAPAEAGG